MLLFKNFLVLFLGLLLMGCGPNLYQYRSVPPEANFQGYREIPVYVDAQFTYRERLIIHQSLVEWNHALNRHIFLKIENWMILPGEVGRIKNKIDIEKEGIMIRAENHNSKIVQEYDDEFAAAFVDDIGGHELVIVHDRIGLSNFHKIMIHELGHLMGARHILINNLMFPILDDRQIDCIDKVTLAQVALIQHLKLENLNFCLTKDF